MEFEIKEYTDIKGKCPFKDSKKKLDKSLAPNISAVIEKLKYKEYHESNLCKYLGNKVWQFRSGRLRILFSISEKTVILLLVFLKKDKKEQNKFIAKAKKMIREFNERRLI